MAKEMATRDTIALITDLATSKIEFSKAFLTAREHGSEIGGGRATVEDAKHWARRNLAARGIRDAEEIRFLLWLRIGVPRMPDD